MKFVSATMIVVAVLAAACSVDPAPPERNYRVDIATPAGAAPFKGTIVVEAFQAQGVYSERPLLFRHSGDVAVLEQYHYQFWAEPPAAMMRDGLVSYLRGAFGTGQVFPADARARGDYTVRARIRRFEQIVDGDKSRAALAMEFIVSDGAGNPRFVLDFNEEATAAGRSLEEHVAALTSLTAKAYATLGDRLRNEIPQSRQ